MKIAAAIEKMTDFYKGNIHDIYHFLKVWAFAKNIGEAEGLDPKIQETLEMAAVVHDIACPLCRVKYGNANGKHQEEESAALIEEFFVDSDLPKEFVDRVSYIVSHHHTITGIDGIDYQILVEADFLVNILEDGLAKEAALQAYQNNFKTESGKNICQEMFAL